jgi:hypothetical protein
MCFTFLFKKEDVLLMLLHSALSGHDWRTFSGKLLRLITG